MIASALLGVGYGFAAAIQPGQFQAYLVSQALAHGWRRTMPAACAPLFSDLPIVALVLLVLTQVPPLAVSILQTAGGVLLLYLAAGAARTWHYGSGAPGTPAAAPRETLVRAALVNLLNPNPYLAWSLVLGPLVLRIWHVDRGGAVAFVAAFYAAIVVTTALTVVLFSSARRLGPRIVRGLVGVSALALALFGLYQLKSGLAALAGGF